MCSHMKQTRARSSCSKLGKLDSPVWQTGQSSFVGSDDSQGHRRLQQGRPSPSQVASDQGEEQDPRQLKKLWRQLRDLIDKKEKETKN
jgi:hypothetical protein